MNGAVRATSSGGLGVDEVRIITFNTAAGNRRIRTRQADFVKLPFYREACSGGLDAPLLALQEVGPEQARALRGIARGGRCRVLHIARPGMGNALVIPDRYAVLSDRRRYYARAQLRGIGHGLRRWVRDRQPQNGRQYGELRMWIEARLLDRRSGHHFTVLNTHLSLERSLGIAQAATLLRRARAAAQLGPVIVAADLNVDAGKVRGHAPVFTQLLDEFPDMGTAVPAGRPNIDYILASGFAPVRSRIWSGDSFQLPGSPDAEEVSDHYPEEAVLRFAPPPGAPASAAS